MDDPEGLIGCPGEDLHHLELTLWPIPHLVPWVVLHADPANEDLIVAESGLELTNIELRANQVRCTLTEALVRSDLWVHLPRRQPTLPSVR